MAAQHRIDERAPVFVISVAAELSGMHPQTLRQYDRLGLVSPQRTLGRGRRYSARDVAKLREVQRLSQEQGINLAGIKRILELQDEVTDLVDQLESVQESLDSLTPAQRRVFAADRDGEISALRRGQRPQRRESGALVLWRPPRRR
ncbi:heat shock protein transcriptional repressor HspR [Brachybacterium fresconis]|uniref:MerR family transcriptional regulator/heat shock protein HspR n=1 Tax=Brachybacterium fresconis TaxID=173363 RepID=A0ABS4YRH9_9MICO|nr:helix-turn-helix transcriptional regulator [Brachybacterium fresconis]MBP2410997.1 MerR family transcriptional regulator/heat shock protein HspR [Brachybacterium fresconis]